MTRRSATQGMVDHKPGSKLHLDWGDNPQAVHASPAGQKLSDRITKIIEAGIVRHSSMSPAKIVNMIVYSKHMEWKFANDRKKAAAKEGKQTESQEQKEAETKECLDMLLYPSLKEFEKDLKGKSLPRALKNALCQNGFKLMCSRSTPLKDSGHLRTSRSTQIRWRRGSGDESSCTSSSMDGLEANLLRHIKMREEYIPPLDPVEVRNLFMQSTSRAELARLLERSEAAAQEDGVDERKLRERRAETFTIKVSNGVYAMNERHGEVPHLSTGCTYTFDQSDSSNAAYPLRFSTTAHGIYGGGVEYTANVSTAGVPGSKGAYTQIVVDSNSPVQLFFYCTVDGHMGNTSPMILDCRADTDNSSVQSGHNPLSKDAQVNVYTNHTCRGRYRAARVRQHETKRR
jgi:hypothetical protein